METRLKKYYKETVISEMMKKFKFKNSMHVPKITKIILNMGVGRDNKDSKLIEIAQKEMMLISGQKPVITRGKRSISGFNLRKGDICGIMVTLRNDRMYEFLDRLITVALPRVRDFSGLPANSFSGQNSYTIGIKEQVIFPEIDYNIVNKVRGLNLTICTNSKKIEEARELLKLMGLPIQETK
ncbi:MAG: 50S ribosomal protein L5 [Candidatus Omnitrophica bacterium]|jgi:large subunit ribosomal protein L5|nr:50S ribosomal protein L5 [Candidatus Omnitrophota bacterium]